MRYPLRAFILLAVALAALAASAGALPVAVPVWNAKSYVAILRSGETAYGVVRLDGTASYVEDPSESLVSWAWRVSGTPNIYYGATTSMTVLLGSYAAIPANAIVSKTLELTVTDDMMVPRTTAFTVDFKKLPSNPAVILFDVPRTGLDISEGEGFAISAADSYDPDASEYIFRSAWDLDSDGTEDIVQYRSDTNGDGVVNGTDADPGLDLSLTWAQMSAYAGLQAIGEHTITLTLRDTSGVEAWDTALLRVNEAGQEAVPEPVSLVFFGTGLAGVFGVIWRRRRVVA